MMKNKIRILYICCLTMLLSCFLLPARVYADMGNTKIESIAIGKTVEGYLKGEETKSFSIKPSEIGRLDITITAYIKDTLGINLYTGDSDKISKTKGYDAEKGYVVAEYSIYVAPKTYYLDLYNIILTNEGSFTIKTKFTKITSIAKDLNNTIDSAVSLEDNGFRRGVITFNETKNYYKIKFSKASKLALKVTGLDETALDITITDSKGNVIDSGWNYYNTTNYSYEGKVPKGTYIICVTKRNAEYMKGSAYTMTLGSYVGIASVKIPSSKSMKVGEASTITAQITPKNATEKYKYSSSNSKVVKVSAAGKLTAVSKGTATITIKTTDGGIKDTCKVTVKEVAVTKVTLDLKKASLYAKETLQLKAVVSPKNATNTKITWKSSDAKIATVNSSGKVTAIKKGTCKITASSGKITASCTITVREKAVPTPKPVDKKPKAAPTPTPKPTQPPKETKAEKILVESITMTSTLKLSVGSAEKLKPVILPENATDKTVEWSSTDSKIVSVKDGTINCLGEGKATIIATSSNGKKAYCTVIVSK